MYVHHLLVPQGRFGDALSVLDRALSIEPTPYVRLALAVIQMDSGDYDSAIQNARWVIARDPTLSFTYSHSGPRVVFVRAGAGGVEGLPERRGRK